MKKLLLIVLVGFALSISAGTVTADLVWSEDFSGIADGTSVNGDTTSTGAGTFVTNGNVAVSGEQLILTADGGRETLQIDSAGVECGFFTFDLQQLTAADPTATPAGTRNSIFTQMTEGGRSTGAAPVSGFGDTINGTQFGAVQTVNYYFNSSTAAFTYVGPDGSTQTIDPGTYDYWQGTTLVDEAQTQTTNGTTAPSSVGSLVFSTFNQENGSSYAFDNLSLNSIVHSVPEPSSSLLLVGLSLVAFTRRRKS